MSESLKDKKILIVGGSSGIGLSVAKRSASAGARILVTSRTAHDHYEYLKQEICEDIEVYSCDITNRKDIESLFDKIGQIDHLAILVRPPQPDSTNFSTIDINQAKAAFETKFWGQYQLIQVASKFLKPDGSIVMTSGIAGEKIYKGALTMAIINAATEVLCRSLAVEIAPIRINAVSPGFIEPKPEAVKQLAKQFPIGGLGKPEAVADTFIHLMKNEYITGSTVVIDGGARLV